MKTQIRKKIRYFVPALLILLMLALLSGCDSGKVSTSMELDSAFSGQRVMSLDIVAADLKLGILTGAKVEDVVGTLSDACPPQLTMSTDVSKTKTTCIFTLSFADENEYRSKVAALLGRTPNITYTSPSEDVFLSGITLKEDFSSSDLFGWAKTALAEKYPQFADKINENVGKGDTAVVFEGGKIAADSVIDIKPVKTHLKSLTVNTTRYGEDDFERQVYITVDPDDLALMGKDRFISSFCKPIADSAADVAQGGWDEETSSYVLKMPKSTFENLKKFTNAVFPGSTAECSDLDDDAFTESTAMYENFSFLGYPCADDSSAVVQIIYNAGDDTTFSAGGEDSAGGKLSGDKKTITYSLENVTRGDVAVISETRYTVDHIAVDVDVSMTGRVTEAIIISFPEESSRSAATRAQRFLKDEYAGEDLTVSVEKIDVAGATTAVSGADSMGSDVYALVISASGSPEKVTSTLEKAFGAGNSYKQNAGSAMSFNRAYNITHNIDISALADRAAYEGEYSYYYTVPMSTFSVARWDGFGQEGSDMLFGRPLKENLESTRITAPAFTVTIQYTQINLPFIIGAVIALIGGLGLLMLLSSLLSAGLGKARANKKEDLKESAVKSVALALVPEEERKELASMPPELIRRPTAVIEPRNDDGLDEAEDEPESLVLFVSTLKILLVSLMVLFFFPFTFVSSTLRSVKLSGFDLFMGKEIFGTTYPADRVTAILMIIPIIMLICLYARNMLPRIITPLFITGASLWQIYYLYQLPGVLDENMAIVRQMVTGYITDPSSQMQMAHTYSIVIYVLIAVSGILLLFADLGMMITKNRREEECA